MSTPQCVRKFIGLFGILAFVTAYAVVASKIAEAARTLGVPGPTKAVYPYAHLAQVTNGAPASATARSSLGSNPEATVETQLHGSAASTPRSVGNFSGLASPADGSHESDDDLFLPT